MKRLAPLSLLSLLSSMLAGCLVMVPGHLYPVQGTLAAQSPVPIYKFTVSGVGREGTSNVTLQGGEECSGHWAPVPQSEPMGGKSTADWDGVYGAGFYVANVLGNTSIVRAVLTCTKGTTLTAEFFQPIAGEAMTKAKGVATDNSGNLFKLTF